LNLGAVFGEHPLVPFNLLADFFVSAHAAGILQQLLRWRSDASDVLTPGLGSPLVRAGSGAR